VQRYGPVKPLPVLDAMSSCSGQSYSRYSVRSVSALIARLVSSSVRFNADLPLANVFTSPAHLLLSARSPANAGDSKVRSLQPGCVLKTLNWNLLKLSGIGALKMR